jgi:metal-sulfur cluster biosynthetic enzyme
MARKISEEDVQKAVGQVKHPAIDHTLLDLGIVKDITVEGNKVTVTFAFPFPNIPIKDRLVNSIREPIEELGAEVEVKITEMNQAELQKFLTMEQEAWKAP